ncbi:hypothetical protein PROFUN_06205 [Planoprotostelium fungivorum]|uniref:Uncharacterized protein n=1 Tax=Planoprotostelium fungivorum TaxID=1890364 RepID=A0A2P6MYZ4_9EUKA|nr:hypothetical protein PROFUN_06205 [Planoprotostelium fungivorum]
MGGTLDPLSRLTRDALVHGVLEYIPLIDRLPLAFVSKGLMGAVHQSAHSEDMETEVHRRVPRGICVTELKVLPSRGHILSTVETGDIDSLEYILHLPPKSCVMQRPQLEKGLIALSFVAHMLSATLQGSGLRHDPSAMDTHMNRFKLKSLITAVAAHHHHVHILTKILLDTDKISLWNSTPEDVHLNELFQRAHVHELMDASTAATYGSLSTLVWLMEHQLLELRWDGTHSSLDRIVTGQIERGDIECLEWLEEKGVFEQVQPTAALRWIESAILSRDIKRVEFILRVCRMQSQIDARMIGLSMRGEDEMLTDWLMERHPCSLDSLLPSVPDVQAPWLVEWMNRREPVGPDRYERIILYRTGDTKGRTDPREMMEKLWELGVRPEDKAFDLAVQKADFTVLHWMRMKGGGREEYEDTLDWIWSNRHRLDEKKEKKSFRLNFFKKRENKVGRVTRALFEDAWDCYIPSVLEWLHKHKYERDDEDGLTMCHRVALKQGSTPALRWLIERRYHMRGQPSHYTEEEILDCLMLIVNRASLILPVRGVDPSPRRVVPLNEPQSSQYCLFHRCNNDFFHPAFFTKLLSHCQYHKTILNTSETTMESLDTKHVLTSRVCVVTNQSSLVDAAFELFNHQKVKLSTST